MTQFGIWKSCLAVQGMPSGVIMYKESEGSDSTGEASYIPAPQPRHTDPEVQTCSLHDHKAPLNRLCFNKIKSTTNINKAPLNQLCLNKIKNTTNIDKAPVKYSLPKKKKKNPYCGPHHTYRPGQILSQPWTSIRSVLLTRK